MMMASASMTSARASTSVCHRRKTERCARSGATAAPSGVGRVSRARLDCGGRVPCGAHRPSLACRASTDRVNASINEDGTLSLPDVSLNSTENGGYTVKGELELPAAPADVYAVLVDYAGAADIFSNIEGTEVMNVDGKLHLLQKCRWKFLMFSGTFNAVMSVREVPEQKVVLFELVQSSFMQEFEGRWKVSRAADGGTIVKHNLTVKPTLAPPGVIGGYTKKIFIEQEVQIFEDLKTELRRRQELSGSAVTEDQ